MAQDSAPNATPSTAVSTADIANASAQVETLSAVRRALSSGSDAIVTAITAIATAVTQKLIGGVVGTTTNRLLKAKTVSSASSAGSLQASGITCDASDNLTGVGSVAMVTGGAFETSTSAGNTALLRAYDVDGAAYTTFGTLTANNTPTFDLDAAVTKGGVGIATLSTNTWTQQQYFQMATLTDAATITWNGQTQQTATVTLGGNRTLGAISNQAAGATYVLIVKQDGTGNRTLAYNSNYFFPGGTDPVLSTAASAIDVLTFVSDGTNMMGVIQKAFA